MNTNLEKPKWLLHLTKYKPYDDKYEDVVYQTYNEDVYHTIGEILSRTSEHIKLIDYVLWTEHNADHWVQEGVKVDTWVDDHAVQYDVDLSKINFVEINPENKYIAIIDTKDLPIDRATLYVKHCKFVLSSNGIDVGNMVYVPKGKCFPEIDIKEIESNGNDLTDMTKSQKEEEKSDEQR